MTRIIISRWSDLTNQRRCRLYGFVYSRIYGYFNISCCLIKQCVTLTPYSLELIASHAIFKKTSLNQ